MRDFFRDLGEFRLVRTIFALWEKISEFGLTPEFHGTVRKREILLNRAMAIAAFYDFVVTTLMMITIGSVAIVKGEYSVLLSILVFGSVFWVVGAAMAGLLWLRHLRIPLFISLDRSNGVEYLGYSLTIIMLLLAGLMLPYKGWFSIRCIYTKGGFGGRIDCMEEFYEVEAGKRHYLIGIGLVDLCRAEDWRLSVMVPNRSGKPLAKGSFKWNLIV